jgi:hypothetical protein
MKKEFALYHGEEFKTLVRQYSYDRMQRDPHYRRQVQKAIAERKAAATKKEAAIAT